MALESALEIISRLSLHGFPHSIIEIDEFSPSCLGTDKRVIFFGKVPFHISAACNNAVLKVDYFPFLDRVRIYSYVSMLIKANDSGCTYVQCFFNEA